MLTPIMTANSGGVDLGFVYTSPVDDDEAIDRGRAAAKRITAGAQVADWLDIGHALAAGSRAAAREAGGKTNGKAYCAAFARWLTQHPEYDDVPEHERAAAVWATKPENWPTVQKFLDSLAPAMRAEMNMRTLKRRLGPPPKPRAPKPESELAKVKRERDEMIGKLADADERLAGADVPFNLDHNSVKHIAKMLARMLDADRLVALIDALIKESGMRASSASRKSSKGGGAGLIAGRCLGALRALLSLPTRFFSTDKFLSVGAVLADTLFRCGIFRTCPPTHTVFFPTQAFPQARDQ